MKAVRNKECYWWAPGHFLYNTHFDRVGDLVPRLPEYIDEMSIDEMKRLPYLWDPLVNTQILAADISLPERHKSFDPSDKSKNYPGLAFCPQIGGMNRTV